MLNNDLDKIMEEEIYNKQVKRYATKYKKQCKNVYGQVKNNDDVERYFEVAEDMANYYEKDFSGELINEDIENMEKALANYENAVSKVIDCYDNPNCDFHYNSEELKQLIDHVYEFTADIDNEWMIKAFQN